MGVLHLGVGTVGAAGAVGTVGAGLRPAPTETKTCLYPQDLPLHGRSILKAYPRGLIPCLMRMGLSLEGVRSYAERFVVYRSEVSNLIVTAGKVLVCKMLIDDGAQWDVGLTYQAIGTSDTAPSLSDTQLGTEVARKTPTLKSRSGNEITLSTFYPAADCSYAIEECGIFGSSTAGASANSGEMFSHWLQSYDNSAGDYDLTFDYVLTVG